MPMIFRRLRAALVSVPALLLAVSAMPAAHAADLGGQTPAGVTGTGAPQRLALGRKVHAL